jgi:hypothetical protein
MTRDFRKAVCEVKLLYVLRAEGKGVNLLLQDRSVSDSVTKRIIEGDTWHL